MKSYEYKTGFTIVEMLIVVAIIVILATMVVGLASRITNKTKEQLVENTIAILDAALEQFHDYGYSYPPPYSEFDFPLDCNDFTQAALETTLGNALGAVSVSISGGTHKNEYSGSEALYFFLSRVPECKAALDKIAGSLITNKDSYGKDLKLTIDGTEYPLIRIVDPWRERGATTNTGKTLRYDYYDEKTGAPETKRNFPVITSAGPDGIFDTSDDISSR
jgi:prepilin-type N-terminal cleavage/methylation domain-containing protein